MTAKQDVNPISADDQVKSEIATYLDLDKPTSFFLFAGAGSGKTRSLVESLRMVIQKNADRLRLSSKQIAVITYTNAACDEIKERIDFDPLIEVRTIHSFVWLLIGGHNRDIKEWLRDDLTRDILDLEQEQAKAHGGKTGVERVRRIERKKERLRNLTTIRKFTYSPTGDNRERDALNHNEVLEIAASFLMNKPAMRGILVNRFPILLIDESQDTNKLLMGAFMEVQRLHGKQFSLGLFGDTMQRIYGDGKVDLGKELPTDWGKPAKVTNHRCPRRVVKLINRIRSAVDNQMQEPRADAAEGFVRLFILRNDVQDKPTAERAIAGRMADLTGDPLWRMPETHVKTLMLEHHMAAKRIGFLPMFAPLYAVDRGLSTTALLNGSLAGLCFFSELVLPVVKASQRNDQFAIARLLRKRSPLLDRDVLRDAGDDQRLQLAKAKEGVGQLGALWANGASPNFIQVLRCLGRTELFDIPETLLSIAARSDAEQLEVEQVLNATPVEDDDGEDVIRAWDRALITPFSQIEAYGTYVQGRAAFDTHQGVKGREFERVSVVMDDSEARGFLFKYDKLFGAVAKSKTDVENEGKGLDSGVDRTRRLFYVTCSRAERSLALVAYSSNPAKVRDHALREDWFGQDEIEMV